MTMHHTKNQQSIAARGPLVFCLAWLCLVTGCATPWEQTALLKDDSPNIDRIQGPTQRSLRNLLKNRQAEGDSLVGGSLKPIKGQEQFLAAKELYDRKRYPEAIKAMKKVAKDFKKSEIREDALFYEGEAAWELEYYSKAHDIYAVLLKEYPSTRHMNDVSERLFKLGRLWLDFPEVAKLGEIQQVNFDAPTKSLPADEPPKLPRSSFLVPNFRNKKEPLFDTAGNGVAALTAVWMNDPTGPLADDSMMLVASYHARRGNYVEADRFFQLLRETFPNSPHVQNAFVLGSHVKLMSYQGPQYESRTLEEAQLLKESTLRLYPNLSEADRIREELARIEDQKALILWKDVEFYGRKQNKKATAIYCHELIMQYPKSPYAEQARQRLVELGPEYESGAAFLTQTDPKKTGFWAELSEYQPTYRLRRSPMAGGPAAKQQKSGARPVRTNDNSKPEADPKIVPDERIEDEVIPPERVRPPATDPEPAPKPRRRWFPPSPGRLPDDADQDAKQMTTNPAGRARL